MQAVAHRRTVHLDRDRREVTLQDEVRAPVARDCRLAFHLGPEVDVVLDGHSAVLSWHDRTASLELPPALSWTAHRGEEHPPLGWYSTEFGHRVPATTLLGAGLAGGQRQPALVTVLRFHDS
ncbi:heparinase II/III family protein [Actinophytocola sp.]|uniref:heparinase II/III domain-containing protein n=1 Tax=Actinophytocola sp. TaxID=1872138 RepID=UPI00389B1626